MKTSYKKNNEFSGLEIAKKYAPIIYFDEKEPFFPVVTGYIITDISIHSPSFSRMLRPPENGIIIEYAIYWDWDIEHHYELEHLWVSVDDEGNINRLEASAHGIFFELWPYPPEPDKVEETIQSKGGFYCSGIKNNANLTKSKNQDEIIKIYSQSGKHAFAPDPDWFKPREKFIKPCRDDEGISGLIEGVYNGKLHKNENRDKLACSYLKEMNFIPSFDFNKKIDLSKNVPLIPWEKLYKLIPRRVDLWMKALSSGNKPENLPTI